MYAEEYYVSSDYVGENSENLLCRLEDSIILTTGLNMVIFHGDTLMRRFTVIINRVFEADLQNYRISLHKHWLKLLSPKLAIFHPTDGYWSFNLYYMQPAFYLFLMDWCLSALCIWLSCCKIAY